MFCDDPSVTGLKLKQFRVAVRSLGFEPVREEVEALVNQSETKEVVLDQFVQYMTEKYLERDPRDELARCFKLFDTDNKGSISFKDMKRVCRELGEDLADDEIREMLTEASKDGRQEIEEEEFHRFMKKTNLF